METQEKNMELNEKSPNVGMEDDQSGQTPDQTENGVRLESEFIEFTESNESNETVQTVTVNCESTDVNLESEFNDNNELTESNEFTESDELTESNEDNKVKLISVKMTLVRLIAEALESAPGGMLVLTDICKAISAKHPQYKMEDSVWKNSLKNKLSKNKNFVKGTKTKSWKLKEGHNILIHEKKVQISKSLDPLSCDLCGAKVAQRGNLVRHFRAVHEKKMTFQCSICKKVFGAKQTLERHLFNFHKLDLGKSVKNQAFLQEPTSNQGEEFDENIRPFCCSICDKAFATKQTLERHLVNFHNLSESKKLAFLQEPANNDANEFCCSICDKAYALKHTLERHIAKVHNIQDSSDLIHWTDPKVKKLKELNEDSFIPDGNNLDEDSFDSDGNNSDEELLQQKHKIKLEPKWPKGTKCEIIRENHCSICKKHLRTSTSLKNHMKKVHEGKKSPKAGPKKTLERHVNALHKHENFLSTNHGEKVKLFDSPFDLEKLECKTCDGSFATKNSFLSHLKQFHSVSFES